MAMEHGMELTRLGKEVLGKGLIGKEICFSKVAYGSGDFDYDTEKVLDLVELRHWRMDLPIVGKEVRGDGKVEIQAKLTNFDVEEGFPEMHKGKGWAGIGYHFVVRKDGKIERGRPEWAIGSHAQGHNSNSIGIHLCGDFNAAKPTDKQIESAAMLIANLTDKYKIPCDRNHIIGHDECYTGVGKTSGAGCPGRNLQSQLDTIQMQMW